MPRRGRPFNRNPRGGSPWGTPQSNRRTTNFQQPQTNQQQQYQQPGPLPQGQLTIQNMFQVYNYNLITI